MIPEEIRLQWQVLSTPPNLEKDAVHLWALDLTLPSASLQSCRQLLSADERMRAEKFRFERDRDYYIFGRGVLRSLIGQYEQISPRSVSFVYGERGKPGLANGTLKFNVSHAYGLALFGFTREREVGVDVELIRPLSDADRLAKRSFSQEEYDVWTAVSEPKKMQAFFNCWTRKEAYIKAIGQGLACPLGSFAVTLRPDEPVQLLHINGSQTEARKWRLRPVTPAPNYVGAVLATGNDWHLSRFAWPG